MIFELAKKCVRVSGSAFDDEIKNVVSAAIMDMRNVGIDVATDYGITDEGRDSLIDRAILLYVKANFGFSEDQERYFSAYEHLKCALSLSGDYRRP